MDLLRARADADDRDAAEPEWPARPPWDPAVHSDVDGLRARADVGGRYPEWPGRSGDVDGLRARADVGDGAAAGQLVWLLAERGDLDELQARADAGDGAAAGLLADRGDLDQAEQILRARADAGDGDLAGQLAGLLERRGQGEEAERLRRFGLNPDGSIACA